MAKGKLKSALNRYQGKDMKLEHQKKQQKEAEKKRRAKKQQKEADDGIEEAGGVALHALDLDVKRTEDGEDEEDESEEWESADDGESKLGFDIAALNDSDSDSEEEEEDQEDGDEDIDVDKRLPTNGTASKSAKITLNGKTQPSKKSPAALEHDDIPLSDLSSASDTDDIVPYQRLTINNTAALERALSSIALPLSSIAFSEHQSVTTPQPVEIPDVEDELNRELAFYSQSLASAKTARALLRKEGAPFTRPADFFAEMVKSDEHMGKIKSKLMDEAANKKASQEARRQRDLKKFGKQVQQEKLKERAKDKKDMLDKVKILKRKRQSSGVEGAVEEDIFDVALDNAASGERRSKAGARGPGGKTNPKRAKKNEKFGFGGKKKFKKSGDAISSGDMSGFSNKKMKGKGDGKTGSKRLGKSRRSKAN